jgi:hypothetical protein
LRSHPYPSTYNGPMSNETLLFLAKLFGVSALISWAIKAIGPSLNVPATDAVALGMILALPLGLGFTLMLLWRRQAAN